MRLEAATKGQAHRWRNKLRGSGFSARVVQAAPIACEKARSKATGGHWYDVETEATEEAVRRVLAP